MKPMAALAAVSLCSVLSLSAGAGAGELTLSDNQLDLVTAGGLLFDSPTGSVARLDGPLAPPPPVVPNPPSVPGGGSPPSDIVFQDSGVTIRIGFASNEGGPAPQSGGQVIFSPGGTLAGAFTQVFVHRLSVRR